MLTVRLQSEPRAPVTVKLTSDDPSEGVVAPPAVTFDARTWRDPVTVTVTGVDDHDKDGPILYNVVSSADSSDAAYAGLKGPSLSLRNLDDEPGILVQPTTGLVTTEAGGIATFVVALQSQPAHPVTIPVSSSNTKEGTVSPDHLTFDAGNWSLQQKVIVTGVDDPVSDGDQSYSVVLGAAASDDPEYAGVDAPDPAVVNFDDESALDRFLIGPNDVPSVCSFLPGVMIADCGVDKNPFLTNDPMIAACLARIVLGPGTNFMPDSALLEVMSDQKGGTLVAMAGFRFPDTATAAKARDTLGLMCRMQSTDRCHVLGSGRLALELLGMGPAPGICYDSSDKLLSSRLPP